MVVIRLSRGGAHKKPFYHVVVADKRSACQGKYLERVGFFNPLARGGAERLVLNQERIQYWLAVGAKTSVRVASLLREAADPTLVERRQAKKAARAEAKAAKQAPAAGSEATEDAAAAA